MKNAASKFGLGRWQFSLWHLLVAMTVIAVLLGIAVMAGPLFSYVVYAFATIALMVLASAIAAGLVYGKGDARAFCLGAGSGVGAVLLSQGWTSFVGMLGGARSFGGLLTLLSWLAIYAVGVVAAGATSVLVRRRMLRKGE